MFVALDNLGNRVYADSAEKGSVCFCPVCNEELRLRKGGKNRPHFAHKQDTDCQYGKDQDYKSEWHIRMQEYFPREACEMRFVDDETGEIHIADVFLEASNTVLEFQHSPISEDEFKSRTIFHLKNGRRIVWLFDESSKSQDSTFGRFRYDEDICCFGITFYQWMRRPRQFLANGPDLKQAYNLYSICVFTGTEGDVFHRIVGQHDKYHWVGFASEPIQMGQELNVEQFFSYDPFWIAEDQEIERRHANARQQELFRQQQLNNAFLQLGQRMNRRNRRF